MAVSDAMGASKQAEKSPQEMMGEYYKSSLKLKMDKLKLQQNTYKLGELRKELESLQKQLQRNPLNMLKERMQRRQ